MMADVSVIIPAFNAGTLIRDAIQSALEQTVVPAEIIIIDDGSTDDSENAVTSFGRQVRYVKQPHKGPGAARNLGMALSSCELLAFLDADDWWHKEKIEKQLRVLDCDPAVQLVTTDVDEVSAGQLPPAQCRIAMKGAIPSSLLARRELFRVTGLFNEEISYGEFVDWYGRLVDSGIRIENVAESLTFRRVHTQNIGRKSGTPADLLPILQKKLSRNKVNPSQEP